MISQSNDEEKMGIYEKEGYPMNRFWIVIAVLLSVNLTISDSLKADDALSNVRIFDGINPIRPRENFRTIPFRHSWNFEGRNYTIIMEIDQKWYNSYLTNRSRDPRNLAQMVTEGTEALRELVREFGKQIPSNWSDKRKVNFILAFVQCLPYVPDDETTKRDEFFRHAIETLVEYGGDCEDTSVLSASILNGLGFELVLIWPEGHIAVGVKGNFSGYYYPYKNHAYYYCETTGRGWKLGMLPPKTPKYAKIIPITSKIAPSEAEEAMPVEPTQPAPPRPKLSSIALIKGINQYETELEFEKAIESFKYALSQRDLDFEQKALAYLYWGCSELGRTNQTEPNYDSYLRKAKEQFSKSFQHNPNQELPPNLKSKSKIRTIFEQVHEKSIGELTISASLRQTKISIYGNGIRKNLGNDSEPIKLFKGSYTIEGNYEGKLVAKKRVTVEPESHKELELEIPPIVKHTPVSEVSVGEIIPLALHLISGERPSQVTIYYGFYGTNNKKLKENNKKMLLSRRQTASSIWTYEVDLPPQQRAGSIRYYIQAEYENLPAVREPKNQYHRISVTDDTFPPPCNQPPNIELIGTIQTVKVKQKIPIEAKVTDDKAVRSVYLFYSFSHSNISPPEEYDWKKLTGNPLGIYSGYIPAQNEEGYVWYYIGATDNEGEDEESKKEKLRIKRNERYSSPNPKNKPSITVLNQTSVYQGIWANYAWPYEVFDDGGSIFDWNRGDAINFTYLREGRTYQTLGVQLDYSYQNPSNTSATFQWGPALGKSPITFTLLAGIAGYRNPDSTRTTSTLTTDISDESIYITPILGAGLKYYPLDRVTIDAAGSFKLPSVFDATSLYHYEVGSRIYITDALNLKIGYSQWSLGNQNIARIQVGLGITF